MGSPCLPLFKVFFSVVTRVRDVLLLSLSLLLLFLLLLLLFSEIHASTILLSFSLVQLPIGPCFGYMAECVELFFFFKNEMK